MSHGDTSAKRPVITLHMVASLDGFVARRDNSVSWLDAPGYVYEDGVAEDREEVERVLAEIDCYVMGSRTYEHALELGWPYGDTPLFVVTSRALRTERESVELYSGDLERLVDEILAPRYGSVWLVGGATLCRSFLDLGLVDRMILSIAPVMLGDGLRLFGDGGTERRWRLTDLVAYRTGFVELSYEIDSADA